MRMESTIRQKFLMWTIDFEAGIREQRHSEGSEHSGSTVQEGEENPLAQFR